MMTKAAVENTNSTNFESFQVLKVCFAAAGSELLLRFSPSFSGQQHSLPPSFAGHGSGLGGKVGPGGRPAILR